MLAKSNTLMGDTLSSKRVLIVEDEPLIAFDLAAEIESGGHTVIGHCTTASAAIEMAGTLSPDIVIMDIGLLGDPSGIDAARQIRHQHGIGCVFISATLDRVDPDAWSDIQPLALIRKPYRDKDLAQAISRIG